MKIPASTTKIIIMILLVAFILLSRMPSFINPIHTVDEADFAVQTAVLLEGGRPYVDFVEKKPPLIHFAYAAAYTLGGMWNMRAVHMLFACFAALTGLLLMIPVKRIAGSYAALIALALFAAYQIGYDLNNFLAANTETLMNLFLAAAAAFSFEALYRHKRGPLLFGAGIMIGMATLARPVGVALTVALFMLIVLQRVRQKDFANGMREISALLAGFAVPLIVCGVWLWSIGVLGPALRWVWTENIRYIAIPVPLALILKQGSHRLGQFILHTLPLGVLGLVHIVRITWKRNTPAYDALLILWLFFSFVATCIGGRFFPHYFIQLLPPLVIIAALGWNDLVQLYTEKRMVLHVALVAIAIVGPAIYFMKGNIAEARFVPRRTALERTIGMTVAARTDPSSKIFVWGHNSDIYFYARRLPASRFVYCSYLTGAKEGYEFMNKVEKVNPDAWDLLMEDLQENPPSLVVDLFGTGLHRYEKFPLDAFPRLAVPLEHCYEQIEHVTEILRDARLFVPKSTASPYCLSLMK